MDNLPPYLIGLYALLALLGYFLPYLIAESRETHNKTAIGVLNLLFGWTGIVWLILLFGAVLSLNSTQMFKACKAVH